MSRIDHLKRSMTNYTEAANPSYTQKDIVKCANILTTYLAQLEKTSSKKDGMLVVKSTVLKLNKLNERCDSELIETGEREEIAEIIILAGAAKGYNSKDYDITEEWREW
jgi:hypothetical protein